MKNYNVSIPPRYSKIYRTGFNAARIEKIVSIPPRYSKIDLNPLLFLKFGAKFQSLLGILKSWGDLGIKDHYLDGFNPS